MKNKKILIVGAGYMAEEYVKVLQYLKLNFDLIGRGKKNVNRISKKYKIISYFGNFNKIKKNAYTEAIICVNEESISKCIKKVANLGIQSILVEKPGAKNFNDLKKINRFVKLKKINLFIAFNRRFYESVLEVKKIINKDKGILSAIFSFTEWIDKVKKLNKKKFILENWFFMNSLHVIDLVFNLIGDPKKLYSVSNRRHPPFRNSIFLGTGISKKNIPFTYHSNWLSAGRWSINLFTSKREIILSPLEDIKFIEKNKTKIVTYKFNKKFDHKFKPGLMRMVMSFLGNKKNLEKIENYLERMTVYKEVSRFNFK